MQFGFMKGKATTDAIIMAKQMQSNFVEIFVVRKLDSLGYRVVLFV